MKIQDKVETNGGGGNKCDDDKQGPRQKRRPPYGQQQPQQHHQRHRRRPVLTNKMEKTLLLLMTGLCLIPFWINVMDYQQRHNSNDNDHVKRNTKHNNNNDRNVPTMTKNEFIRRNPQQRPTRSRTAATVEKNNNPPTTEHDDRRRLVILVGPHKSASSSTQEFFFRHATGGVFDPKRRLSTTKRQSLEEQQQLQFLLKDWIWPYHPSQGHYTSRKAFAILVREVPTDDNDNKNNKNDEQRKKQELYNAVYDSIDQAIHPSNTSSTSTTTKNVIVGSEEFDRWGSTPYTHRHGIQAMTKLIHWIQQQSRPNHNQQKTDTAASNTNTTTTLSTTTTTHWNVDIVIAYRRPRSDHWFSIWREIAPRIKVRAPRNNVVDSASANRTSTTEVVLQPYTEWICPMSVQQQQQQREMSSSTTTAATTTLSASQQQQQQQHRFPIDPYHDLELWEYLDAVANPLGLALELLQSKHSGNDDKDNNISSHLSWTVHLMDMSGIEQSNNDISHAIACHVLNVNLSTCTTTTDETVSSSSSSRKVTEEQKEENQQQQQQRDHNQRDNDINDSNSNNNNDNRTKTDTVVRENQKEGDPGLTSSQRDEIEFLLRMRDCYYRDQLLSFVDDGDGGNGRNKVMNSDNSLSSNRLVIHFGDTIWDGCVPSSTNDDTNVEKSITRRRYSSPPQWNVTSTDDILSLLQDHCMISKYAIPKEGTTNEESKLSMDVVREYRRAFIYD